MCEQTREAKRRTTTSNSMDRARSVRKSRLRGRIEPFGLWFGGKFNVFWPVQCPFSQWARLDSRLWRIARQVCGESSHTAKATRRVKSTCTVYPLISACAFLLFFSLRFSSFLFSSLLFFSLLFFIFFLDFLNSLQISWVSFTAPQKTLCNNS